MKTARIFKSGNSQAVRLPKEFHLEGAEVYMKRGGPGVLLMPKGDPWALLSDSVDKFSCSSRTPIRCLQEQPTGAEPRGSG